MLHRLNARDRRELIVEAVVRERVEVVVLRPGGVPGLTHPIPKRIRQGRFQSSGSEHIINMSHLSSLYCEPNGGCAVADCCRRHIRNRQT